MSASVNAIASTSQSKNPSFCRNPTGKNQYTDSSSLNDPRLPDLLKQYHAKGVADKKALKRLLFDDYGIKMSESTITRRRRELNLRGSRLTTRELSDEVKQQLILDQMAKDPAGRIGPRTVKAGILKDTGIHLSRDWIVEEMRTLDPKYATRGPAHTKARRQRRLEGTCPSEQGPTPTLQTINPPSEELDEDSEAGYDPPDDYLPTNDTPESHTRPVSLARCTSPSPSINLHEILAAVERTTPQMVSLYKILEDSRGQHLTFDNADHDRLMKCMEAAAMLERQLARVASACR